VTALKAHEVGRFLARPDLETGVILVYGPDTGLVRESAQRLLGHYSKNDPESLVVLDGSELDAEPSRLAVEAKMQSLFGGRRVLRVRGASKSLTTTLADLLSSPMDTVVVLEAGNLTPKDALRALVETSKSGRALPCYADTDETLMALIRDTFNKAGIAADPDVVPLLRESLGNDREITRRELDKLLLFAAQSKRLTAKDVLTLCADNAALALDDVLDASAGGEAERLDAAISRALTGGLDAQRLLIAATGHFAQLRRWRMEVDGGRALKDVLDGTRPRPHFSRRSALERQVRIWSEDALTVANERLQLAMLDSRRKSALTETITRRVLLFLCLMSVGRG